MKLRYYQYEAKQATYEYWIKNPRGSALLSMATGTGKSLVVADITKETVEQSDNKRVIILSHIKEILEQNVETLRFIWKDAPIDIYSASLKKKCCQDRIVVASIQSAHTKANIMGFFSLAIIDEAHLISEKNTGMYRKFITGLRKINPNIRILGLSATPWRTKGGLLTKVKNPIFDDVVYTYTLRQGINDGVLSPLISKYSLIQADMSEVPTLAGEFHLGKMAEAFNNEYLTQMATDEIIKYGHNRRAWLLFGSSVDHAHRLCEVLIEKNIEAACITGKTATLERECVLRQFKNGEKYRAITNNNVLTTGTDIPRVDLIAILRATKSSGLFLQAVGRGTRLSPQTEKESALLLDYGGNLERFGCVDLINSQPSSKNNNTKAPIKICPACQSAHHISLLMCGDCGYVFPINSTYKHDETATNLAAMSDEIDSDLWYDVEGTFYELYRGKIAEGVRKLDVLQVTYVANNSIFREWVCINHTGVARHKALKWLEDRIVCNFETPEEKSNLINTLTINNVINTPDILLSPKKIKVYKKRKYSEIINYLF